MRRDFDQAARLFEQATRRGPNPDIVFILHAYAAARAGRHDVAQSLLATHLEIVPESRTFIEGLLRPTAAASR